jgi:bifunctional UDP-N-acetylglucosamine pyrophosphorylase / glucosamine-1-phosphate N-acetyltransferase
MSSMQAVVLAAGKGTRMCSDTPKVLHEVLGRTLVGCVLDTLAEAGIRKPVVVVGAGAEKVKEHTKGRATPVLQAEQRGTGHAVMMTRKALAGFRGDILIWPGDMPLVKHETLKKLIRAHREAKCDVSVLSAIREDPHGYGRILRAGGAFCGIREELDAAEHEKSITEVNTGIYLFKSDRLFSSLAEIKPDNRKNELYLTDTIEILDAKGCKVEAFPFAASEEGQGVNSRTDLAMVMEKLSQREIAAHQARGVTFVSPQQTFVAPGVKIAQDTVIYPWCYIEQGVTIGSRCEIGPFAKIRKGSAIGEGTTIGSFVEVNRSRIGKNVSAKHLAYLGDAVVGDRTNIGAGTITANYDGREKHVTRIGSNVLVGSDTVFVAPVSVESGARTGAGAVLTSGTRVRKGEIMVGVPARPLGAEATKGKRVPVRRPVKGKRV